MAAKQRVMLIRTSYLPNKIGKHIVPPLGILTLASVLRKERPGDVEIRVVDTGIKKLPSRQVAGIIREYDPHVVGFSSLTLETSQLHKI